MTRNFDRITLTEAGVGASTGPAGGTRQDWNVDAAFCVSRGSNRVELASSVPWEAQEHVEQSCQAPSRPVASTQRRVTWGMLAKVDLTDPDWQVAPISSLIYQISVVIGGADEHKATLFGNGHSAVRQSGDVLRNSLDWRQLISKIEEVNGYGRIEIRELVLRFGFRASSAGCIVISRLHREVRPQIRRLNNHE